MLYQSITVKFSLAVIVATCAFGQPVVGRRLGSKGKRCSSAPPSLMPTESPTPVQSDIPSTSSAPSSPPSGYKGPFECANDHSEVFLASCEDTLNVSNTIAIKGDIEFCSNTTNLFNVNASANDITIDCEGNALYQTLEEGGSSKPIRIVNLDNDVTIKNCVIMGDWADGIRVKVDAARGRLLIVDSLFLGSTDAVQIDRGDNGWEDGEILKVRILNTDFVNIKKRGIRANRITIDLQVKDSKMIGVDGSNRGIEIINSVNDTGAFKLDNVLITGWGSDGVKLDDLTDALMSNVEIKKSKLIANGGNNIEIDLSVPEGLVIERSAFTFTAESNLDLDDQGAKIYTPLTLQDSIFCRNGGRGDEDIDLSDADGSGRYGLLNVSDIVCDKIKDTGNTLVECSLSCDEVLGKIRVEGSNTVNVFG